MKDIIWASETKESTLEQVGGKGANLAEMMNVGLPVPAAFMVTAGAYHRFVEEAGIGDKIDAILSDLDVDSNDELKRASEEIQELILSESFPKELAAAIRSAYEDLGDDVEVAIRSSATAEDLPEASFAGQQDTYLHVSGGDDVLEHVQRCWASLFTRRAIYYRVKNDFPHEKVHMAVVVQRMVDADKAGVVFTRNPTSGANQRMIEAAWGLGEGVVSGQVSPDLYVTDADGELLDETIATKQTMFVRADGGGVETVEVPEDKRKQRVLTDDEIDKLARLASTLDDHYGSAQDVEWAFEDGELYVLQTRPITTIKEPEAEPEPQEAEEASGPSEEAILTGLGAAPGMGAGEVVQLETAEELDRCEEGDILVTTMTTPDMVPAMKRASAIVTDEGGMTCFPGDTTVLTDQGLLPMREIRERLADEEIRALSIDPDTLEMSWKPILTSLRRRDQVIEVSVSQTDRSSANTVRMTPDHKMMILDGTELVERPMEKVLERNEMVTVADHIPAPSTPGRWPVPPYLAGALFADGHWSVQGTRGSVEFIQKDDPEKQAFIEQVRAGMEGPLAATVGERTVESSATIRGHAFEGSSLRLYAQQRHPAQLVQRTYDQLEHLVIHASEEELVAFLAGLADGDGTFQAEDGTRLQIYTGDRELATGIVLACLRLGIQPTVSPNRDGCENIQIREGLAPILEQSQRFDAADLQDKDLGTKLLPARQVLSDTVDQVDPGRMRPYVDRNLLLDAHKLDDALGTVDDPTLREQLAKVTKAPIRGKRVRFEREIGVQDVYNLTVEDNHNYVVFTDQLTPVLVANCHAAIVSRELGIPCVVGTKTGTTELPEGRDVTVDGDKGKVFEGISETEDQTTSEPTTEAPQAATVPTATAVKVNVSMPEATERAAATGADGVGLLRVEHIVLGLGEHPMEMIEDGRGDVFVDYLVDGIGKVADAFGERPVWVRTLDAPTDEFRTMEGGDREPDEANPMLGFRGIRRDLGQTEILRHEFRALKTLRDNGHTNVGVMLPLVQDPREIRKAKQIAREEGLDPDEDPSFEFGIMIEVPASAILIDEMIDEGLDFVSFGTNDLTQYTLAVDRNNENVADLFDEFHPAVGRLIEQVIKTCRERGVQTSICGQAGSDPRFGKKLVEWGITSISANIDAVDRVRQMVAREEQRMILEEARNSSRS